MQRSGDQRSKSSRPTTIHGFAQSGDLLGLQKMLSANPSLLNERNPVARISFLLSFFFYVIFHLSQFIWRLTLGKENNLVYLTPLSWPVCFKNSPGSCLWQLVNGCLIQKKKGEILIYKSKINVQYNICFLNLRGVWN